ncbi:hypothetical protein VNI00_010017 [Paramarasmius palmivorus]|uniref:Plasmid pRiA4b Orf3-like domain-containing protein n=1 Tax=Paramarasmius palmivorus TaxID=297713 RepID=A0AAW0CKP2_9AGAR
MDPKSIKLMDLANMLEEAEKPGGKIPRNNRFPLYVKMAHSDDGKGIPESVYEDPRTFEPEPGPNGEIHTWGLFPYDDPDEGEPNCNIPNVDIFSHMQRRMKVQMTYFHEPSPEEQFVDVLIERKVDLHLGLAEWSLIRSLALKREQLRKLDLKDLPKRDVILKVNVYLVRNPKGEHRIWRRFRVSGGIKISVLQDKVLTPILGCAQISHEPRLLIMKGSESSCVYIHGLQRRIINATSVDAPYSINVRHDFVSFLFEFDAPCILQSGYKWLDDSEYMLAHLYSKEGDRFGYLYDLGDRWFHEILVEKILPVEKSDGRVEIIAGDGACPGENMKGCWPYRDFMNAYDKDDPATQREKKRTILDSPNYKDFRKPPLLFNPHKFDIDRATEALAAALGSGASIRAGMKSFFTPLHPAAFTEPRAHIGSLKKGQSVVKTFDPSDAGGFWEETTSERRDRRAVATCAFCGKPGGSDLVLRSCGGCRQMLEHQKV